MAARLLLSSLNSNERSKIMSDLIFTPKKQEYPKRGGQWKPTISAGEPILGFHSEGDHIRLPKAYANQHFRDRIIPNNPPNNVKFNFTGSLYDIQKIEVEKSYKCLMDTGGVILALHTGFGKTIVSAYLGHQLQGLILILCEATIIIKQWAKTFEEFTDAKVWIVGETQPNEAHVVICMDTRFHKLPLEYRMKFRTVIVDEAHCWATPTRIPCFLGVEPEYFIAATATPRRTDGLFSAVEAFSGEEKVVKMSQKSFNVVKYETGIKVPIKQNVRGEPDWSALTKALCENDDRNKLIYDTVKMNHQRGYKILILTWRADHVKLLCGNIAQMGISVDYLCGNRRRYSDSWVLVGTISKIGKAFDEKNACDDFRGFRLDLLLLVGSMKSDVLLEQVAGRVFRADFPNIIHFCDNNRISKRHWTEGAKWYRSRGGQIIECQSPLVKNKRGKLVKAANKEVSSQAIAQAQLQRFKQNSVIDSDITPHTKT